MCIYPCVVSSTHFLFDYSLAKKSSKSILLTLYLTSFTALRKAVEWYRLAYTLEEQSLNTTFFVPPKKLYSAHLALEYLTQKIIFLMFSSLNLITISKNH